MSRGHIAAALAAATLALGVPGTAQAVSLPLEGWWPLNEGSGQTIRDWSGNRNNGYLGASPTADAADPSWIKGVFLGSALRFGGGQFVTIPDAPSLEPQRITVAAWFRGDASPGKYRYIMSKGFFECQTASYGLYTGIGGGLSFYIAKNAYDFYVSPAAPTSVWDGKWHHAAGTFDGTTVRLYIDGVQVGSGTPSPTPIDYDRADGTGHIGANEPAVCDEDLTLVGDVDGVQIWSEALPVDRIWSVLKPIVALAR
ncbi:concanavalin A-like lectin/glucanase superfamily protein [Solirubrobacter pauli]|uniref:Concanavalin A-like lectin/glucanase superfamily protein n=1 Tax=Solirubrobacter pauli TaxID=166793 RepID=A0A660LG14_9ACTN|nr:LamG domain-containing protein [Solirubrobacter pauli]RKQ94077.1 concanavalin A-like lectin/glucanase superfamily protein [Solirubrobacter pauli]